MVTNGGPVTVTGNRADSLLPSIKGPCYRHTLCDWTAVAASSPLPPQQGENRGLCSFGSKFPFFYPRLSSPRVTRCPSAPLAGAASPSTTPCSLPTVAAPRMPPPLLVVVMVVPLPIPMQWHGHGADADGWVQGVAGRRDGEERASDCRSYERGTPVPP